MIAENQELKNQLATTQEAIIAMREAVSPAPPLHPEDMQKGNKIPSY